MPPDNFANPPRLTGGMARGGSVDFLRKRLNLAGGGAAAPLAAMVNDEGGPQITASRITTSATPSRQRTKLGEKEEAEFQAWIRGTEWYSEFRAQHGESPDLDTKDYDYRAAWKAGLRPERDPHDQNRYHWPSSTPSGRMLKSEDHPTAWKEHFMRATGLNPDEIGGELKLQALKGAIRKAEGSGSEAVSVQGARAAEEKANAPLKTPPPEGFSSGGMVTQANFPKEGPAEALMRAEFALLILLDEMKQPEYEPGQKAALAREIARLQEKIVRLKVAAAGGTYAGARAQTGVKDEAVVEGAAPTAPAQAATDEGDEQDPYVESLDMLDRLVAGDSHENILSHMMLRELMS
jgi:hypothetical protein